MDVRGCRHQLLPLSLVPEMCSCLGADMDAEEWGALCAKTEREKTVVFPITRTDDSSWCDSDSQVPDVAASSLQRSMTQESLQSDANSMSGVSATGMFDSDKSVANDSQNSGGGSGASSSKENRDKHAAELSRLKIACRQKQRKINRLQKQLAAVMATTGCKTLKSFQKKRKREELQSQAQLQIEKSVAMRNLTFSGMVAVGLRMCLSSCSALGFPAASWNDISRQTVARAEVYTAAACVLRSVITGQLVYQVLRKKPDPFGKPALAPFLSDRLEVVKRIIPDLPDGPVGGEIAESHDAEGSSNIERVLELFSLVGFPDEARHLFLEDDSQSSYSDQLVVCGVSVQNDATNNQIWQRKKLTSAVIQAGVLTNHQALARCEYDKAFFFESMMPLVSTLWLGVKCI